MMMMIHHGVTQDKMMLSLLWLIKQEMVLILELLALTLDKLQF